MRHQNNFFEISQFRCNNLIAGITAVIGIISGVLLITKTTKYYICKISDKRKKLPNEYENVCNVCCLAINPNDEETFVKCATCQKNICRRLKCAVWSSNSFQWECELCKTSKESFAKTSSWVADQISTHQDKLIHPLTARSEICLPITEYNDNLIHIEGESQSGSIVTNEQKLRIREYVEEIVAEILGCNLDTISINQLSNNENYLNLFYKYHSKLSNILINLENVLIFYTVKQGDTQTLEVKKNATCNNNKYGDGPDVINVSEARLRQLIQKIIAETITFPILSNNHADTSAKNTFNYGYQQRHHHTGKYFEPKIYQDLLATAVLNTIVEKQSNQCEHVKHEAENNENKNIHLGSGNLDSENNFNVENLSTVSESSDEPRSDCSYTLMERNPNANEEQSYELQQNMVSHMVHLPDFMAVPTESDDEYTSVTSSVIGDGTWETNWLFKKKKHNSSASATISSVGMLVPDPTEDIRAQIGDKTADEVSDLSEFGSDTDDSLDILQPKLEPISDLLINKHLIGGANDKIILDELIDQSNIVSSNLQTKRKLFYNDTFNEHVVDTATKDEAINNNVYQQTSDGHYGNNETAAEITSINENSNSLEDNIDYNSNPNDNEKQTSTVEDYHEECLLNQNLHNCSLSATATNTISTAILTEVISNKSTNNLIITNTNFPNTHNNTDNSTNKLLTSVAQYKDVFASCSASSRELLNNCKPEHDTNLEIQIINDGDGDKGNKNDDDDDNDNDDLFIFRHFLPGSIAEREYKKWNNAVEMPNNPYAPEALKRRISGSQERFIDLPNISPIKELSTLNFFKTDNSNSDEIQIRENDYKRYRRDYYINSSPTSSQSTPVKEFSALKDANEPTNEILSHNNDENDYDLNQTMPIEVVENNTLSVDSSKISERTRASSGLEEMTTIETESYDSDTIKINELHDHDITIETEKNKDESKSNAVCNLMESCINTSINTRGSTPTAFKFLQPKRKLMQPSQVLSVEEDTKDATTTHEKPVIEEEVAKALPSVKALARAFLLAANTTQSEKRWLQTAKAVSKKGNIKSKTAKSILPHNRVGLVNNDDDVTITSDLSSLETDSSSAVGDSEIDIKNPSKRVENSPNALPVGQGHLKSNIAFFENLKNN